MRSIKCKNCGAETTSNNRFCQSCGKKISKLSKKSKYALVIAGVISLILITCIFLGNTASDNYEQNTYNDSGNRILLSNKTNDTNTNEEDTTNSTSNTSTTSNMTNTAKPSGNTSNQNKPSDDTSNTTKPSGSTMPPAKPSPSSGSSNSGTGVSLGSLNALQSAKNYLSLMAFSASGLKEQLEYEGYTASEVNYAINNCGANWNEQALKSAKNYLDLMAFSYSGLKEQLEFEGFTSTEATYGVDNSGANWNEQAVKSAKNYLSLMPFSRSELISQLEFEGFTYEQAVYGVNGAGL